jgi:hypothetical protein
MKKWCKKQGEEEYPTNNEEKESYIYWSHLSRNCLLKHFIECKTADSLDVVVRRGRRCKQLRDNPKQKENTVN